jgi:hypothetical protein
MIEVFSGIDEGIVRHAIMTILKIYFLADSWRWARIEEPVPGG